MSDQDIPDDAQRTSPAPTSPAYESTVVDRARNLLHEAEEDTGALPEAIAGAIIGKRYKLLELIGEGGMGVVWMAEQRSPMRRQVAVKLIKAGMDSAAVVARFEAERQALAMMDHPNIARIFDGGTTDRGHPFFIMELVKGLPLTRYCDERRMTLDERLALFIQVCGAVQHAHQKGIIHRDLKPGNLLVTEHDGKPVPKVIDFGLVKALGGSSVLTEHTLHTSYGAVAGTPHYMAPEQVAINALDVDTRADIYSLGVILYELLAGTTPHELAELHRAAWEEIRRVIRDVDPPRPSLRITQSKTLANLAATRHTEPARLSKLIAGDLDWIVMKSLEKDRHRRYGSVSDLAADIQRHVSGEPVLAAPPTTGYRLQKFVSKHRAGIATASGILLVLVAGVLVSTWQAIRALEAQHVAQSKTLEAEKQKTEAQQQKLEAQRQREVALAAGKKAEAEAATVQRQLADSYVQNGIFAWDQHDPGLAALWFVRALKLDRGNPHRELMDRLRLGDSFRQCVLPTIITGPIDEATPRRRSGWIDQLMPEPNGGLVAVTASGARLKVNTWATSAYEIGDLLLLGGKSFAQLVDIKTGVPVSAILAAPNVFSFDISRDRKLIITNTWHPATVYRIWDAQTGRQVLLGSLGKFENALLSPDGKLIAVSTGQVVQLWNLEDLRQIGKDVPYPSNFTLTEVNDSGHILTNDGHDKIRMLHPAEAAAGPEFQVDGEILGMSSDGLRVLARAGNARFSVFDVCTGLKVLDLRYAGPDVPQFSRDGKSVVAGPFRWNAQLRKLPSSLSGMSYPPGSERLRLSPDGKTVATFGWILRVWDADTLQPLAPPRPDHVTNEIVGDLRFIPHSTDLIVILADHERWRLARCNHVGTTIRLGAILREDISSLSNELVFVSPDGQYILVRGWLSSTSNSYEVFSTETLQKISMIKPIAVTATTKPIGPANFSPDSRAVVGWGENGQLAAWDVAMGRAIANPPQSWRAQAAPGLVCPDGKSYFGHNPPQIYSLEDGTPLTPVFPVAARFHYDGDITPDGVMVITTLDDSVRLWDARNAVAVTSALACDKMVNAVAISRDGASALSLSMPTPDRRRVMPPILRRWSILPTQLSDKDAELVSEVLSGQKADDQGGTVLLNSEDYSKTTSHIARLHREVPEFFIATASPEPIDVSPSYRHEVEERVRSAKTPDAKKQLAVEWDFLASLELRSRLYKEAELLDEQSLALDDSCLAARDHLANAYACLGRFNDALEIYRKFAGQAYQTPAPWFQSARVGAELINLSEAWPDGSDDPAFGRMLAVLSDPTSRPSEPAGRAGIKASTDTPIHRR